MVLPPIRDLWKRLRRRSSFVGEDAVLGGLWMERELLVLPISLFHSMGLYSFLLFLFFFMAFSLYDTLGVFYCSSIILDV